LSLWPNAVVLYRYSIPQEDTTPLYYLYQMSVIIIVYWKRCT